MEIKMWQRQSSGRETITLGRSNTQRGIKDDHSKPKWTTFWKKIRRERNGIFTSSGAALQVSYDPNAYSQNFDRGSASAEPDNLSRSFSARFADPSRLLRMKP
ncbi:Golgin subfamily A member 4 [Hibiscus syriacus]|uniref:Golgin subfamily A member 4 n=1 Tax=Hibiscus syriacus TaxID=106335 RepID=A0A6A2Z992_HIBSY|nr:Golgin subfamily A member 4 [Hibiscus syriacus]